jgi:hypothetical protein
LHRGASMCKEYGPISCTDFHAFMYGFHVTASVVQRPPALAHK